MSSSTATVTRTRLDGQAVQRCCRCDGQMYQQPDEHRGSWLCCLLCGPATYLPVEDDLERLRKAIAADKPITRLGRPRKAAL